MSEELTPEMFTTIIQRVDTRLERLESTIDTLAAATKTGFDQVSLRLNKIETTLEHIELRQDQMVYRFEFNELATRVDRLE